MHESTSDKLKGRNPVRAMLGRDFRLFVREVPAALLIAVLLGLFCVLAASALSRGAESGYSRAPLAIVDEDGSLAGSLVISMISGQDFTAPLQITKAKAAKAEQGLADGTYSAILYLPKGYSGDIMVGNRTAARLVVADGARLHGDVMQLLTSFGEELMGTGQLGIFAGENLVWEQDSSRHAAYLRNANSRFLSQAFADPGLIRQQTPYALTGVSAEQWYVLVYASAFFQLMILGCGFVTRDCRSGLLRRLAAEGIRDWVFLGCKFGILLVFYAILAGLSVKASGIQINLAGLLPALAASAAVGLALVLCLPGRDGITAVTALAGIGLVACGGIIPRMELPMAVTTLGDWLPLGAAARLTAQSGALPLAACIGWTVLAWAASMLRLRHLREGVAE